MQGTTKTVTEYLASLSPERRQAISTVRWAIKQYLPKGYVELMQYGMISYVVPLTRYPDGYLGDKKTPLPYVSLTAQKNHMAVYLQCVYADKKIEAWVRKAFKSAGKEARYGQVVYPFSEIGGSSACGHR